MAAILGDAKIINKDGAQVDLATITGPGKTIGLYFSAHWCPPCRGFTPKLAAFYEGLKKAGKTENFEIIFVSCDRDQTSFDSYYGDMPWLALDFSDRDTKDDLSAKHEVRGIPCLVILDGADGTPKDKNGRAAVDAAVSTPGAFPGSWE